MRYMKAPKAILISLATVSGVIMVSFVILFDIIKDRCRSDIQNTRVHINAIKLALDLYHGDCQSYPSTEETLKALQFQSASCKEWGPDPYFLFPNTFLGCKVEDYFNLVDRHHETSYSQATLSLAAIFLGNCLSLQRIFSKSIFYPPRDSWGNEYLYQSDGKTFEIKSLGKDGLPGGDGPNRDISSKELE